MVRTRSGSVTLSSSQNSTEVPPPALRKGKKQTMLAEFPEIQVVVGGGATRRRRHDDDDDAVTSPTPIPETGGPPTSIPKPSKSSSATPMPKTGGPATSGATKRRRRDDDAMTQPPPAE